MLSVSRFGASIGRIGLALWLPCVLVALWWISTAGSTDQYVPPFTDIMDSVRSDWLTSSILTSAVIPSLASLVAGLAIAFFLGVGLGVAIGSIRALRVTLAPFLDIMRSFPGLALMPLFLLIFGLGSSGEIAIIAFACLWPILLNTIDGVAGLDVAYRDVRRSLRLGRWMALTQVILPGAAIAIVAGLNLSIAIGVTFMVAYEMFSGSRGMGYELVLTQRNFDIPGSYAGALVAGALGYLIALGSRTLERRTVLRWHYERDAMTRRVA